ncbi:MAG: electron transport complex subunit RsxE [Lachnospiraceae bacterium]|nr:electron transport complex subunit RsxE [Lachnospiraceae bacterium]
MNKSFERLYNGIIKENPTFVLTLGMCPTLAVTTSAINGLGMGLTTAAVLALSNLFISALRKVIPDKVRIPAFIVIVASFVTMVQLLLEAFIPSLNAALGIYIPLIVVNCIILGRAESYAYHNPVIPSFFDGVGMGLGFTVALTLLGIFREFIGSGTFFGMRVFPEEYGVTIFVLAPGAFFVLAVLVAIQNFIKDKMAAKGKDVSKIGSGCASGCAGCAQASACGKPKAKAYRKVQERKAEEEAEESEEYDEEDDEIDEILEDTKAPVKENKPKPSDNIKAASAEPEEKDGSANDADETEADESKADKSEAAENEADKNNADDKKTEDNGADEKEASEESSESSDESGDAPEAEEPEDKKEPDKPSGKNGKKKNRKRRK